MLPVVSGSTEVVGEILASVALETGLREGTPVVAGVHDVDASAIGTGCVNPGQLAIVAGTWSINEVISSTPVTDPRWACRNFVEPGRWMNMAYSPASATNLEWFVRELCPLEVERATALGISPFTFVNDEIAGVLAEPSPVLFHPFLYGSAYGDLASAAFLGVRGWHRRGYLLRAILEGVVFNHRMHIEALRSAFSIAEARLSGGGGQSAIWSQMFADALGLPVIVTDAREAGARGAAMCGAVGVGMFPTLQDAADQCVRVVRKYEPDAVRAPILDDAYASYQLAASALAPVWERLG
jgi:L-xylulokinase